MTRELIRDGADGPVVFCVVVVYNRSCEESSACQALLGAKSRAVPVIFDNSDRDFGNREWCARNGWVFLGGEGNLGLSKAYNEAADYCRSKDPDGTICFLDDDALISDRYFKALGKSICENGEADIFVPILSRGDGILSPSVLQKNGGCRLFRSKDEIFAYQEKALTAVNSGLAVRIRIYADFRYDERLFLDYVDHSFFREMNRRGARIGFFEGEAQHSISSHEHPPKSAAVSRFRIFVRDTRVFWKHRPSVRFRILFRRAVRLTAEYKSMVFVRILLSADRDSGEGSKGDTV